NRLQQGAVDAQVLEQLARRLARFHADADTGEHVAAWGRYEVVARNARENLDQSSGHVGLTVSPAVHARLRSLTADALTRLRPLIESRAARRVPRDTHGDLRLEHVYLFPAERPPG